jgi:hypothetical protein
VTWLFRLMRQPFRIINRPFREMVLSGFGIDGARRRTADSRSRGSSSRSGGSALCRCGGQSAKGASWRFRGGASSLRGEITDQGAAPNLSSAALSDFEEAHPRSAEKIHVRECRQIFPRRRSAIPDGHAFIPGRQPFIPASSLDVCEDLSSTLYRSRPLHRKEN